MIIKLTRIKREKDGIKEFNIWVNSDYIMGFRESTESELGNSRIDIYFPDTVRAYMVKETSDEIYSMINKIPAWDEDDIYDV